MKIKIYDPKDYPNGFKGCIKVIEVQIENPNYKG